MLRGFAAVLLAGELWLATLAHAGHPSMTWALQTIEADVARRESRSLWVNKVLKVARDADAAHRKSRGG